MSETHDAATDGTPSKAAVVTLLATAATRMLLEHLPRERGVYEPKHQSPAAANIVVRTGGYLTALGADESELLEYVSGRFKVLVQVRPKYLCGGRKTTSQAEAPSRPLAISYAGARLFSQSQCNTRVQIDVGSGTAACK